MSPLLRTSAVIVVCTVAAGAIGGWAGVHYGFREASHGEHLHEMLHHELHLSADQEKRIASLETAFAARRKTLEAAMRAANQDLARAITVRHQYDPEARQAVERLHAAMMELQEATIEHVLAMRAVLTEEQARQFVRAVNEALTAGAP
jgi:Spy/CpxP family protein refolding chaperone